GAGAGLQVVSRDDERTDAARVRRSGRVPGWDGTAAYVGEKSDKVREAMAGSIAARLFLRC
ncbi:hypothetical protein, partial [Nonomuraea angiospora]|uniref:hypothetical protein n=1 Tax=Nonomuraea angiospora TaxID=46172 RepID=UPI0029B341A8